MTLTKNSSLLFFLILTVCIVFALGLVMIFSTTSADVLDHGLNKSTHQALLRQMAYAVCGGFLAYTIHQIGYRTLLSISPMLLAILTFLLLLCLIPGIGRQVNGSKRWLHLFGMSFQPSEFVKYVIPAYVIHHLCSFSTSSLTLKDFLKLVGHVAIPIILIWLEPNNGTVGVIVITLLVAFVLTRVPFRFWALPLLIFMSVGILLASQLPYAQARLRVYWNPTLDLKGKGHQPHQAKIAAGSGKLFGKGPGNGLQKLSYLPEAQNDYIAAIYAEEFGFVGILSLMILYMLIACAGFTIAYTAWEQPGCYLAACVTFLICFQAFMNLGVVSGLLPSTGLNLPFFSQGGTSLMANLMGLGILLSVSSASKKEALIV